MKNSDGSNGRPPLTPSTPLPPPRKKNQKHFAKIAIGECLWIYVQGRPSPSPRRLVEKGKPNLQDSMKVPIKLHPKQGPNRVAKFDLDGRGPAPTGAAAANGAGGPPQTTHPALETRRLAARAARTILCDPGCAECDALKTAPN